MHGFRNAIESPIVQIPGTSVRLDAQLDTLWAGVNIKFGGLKRKGPADATNWSADDIVPPSNWSNPFVPPPPDTNAVPSPTSDSSGSTSTPPPSVAAAHEPVSASP